MYYTTLLLTGQELQFRYAALFLFASTLLYYSFHHYSHLPDFSGMEKLKSSLRQIKFSIEEKVLWSLSGLTILIAIPKINYPELITFSVVAVLSTLYSFPLIPWKGKYIRIREILHLKLPVLSVSFALLAVWVPLAGSNFPLDHQALVLLGISQALFVFSLCIPFELRDMEKDRKMGVPSLPVVYGSGITRTTGMLILIPAVILHHLPAFNFPSLALDISCLFSFSLILFSPDKPSEYYCRIYVDGLMILQFILVYLFLC